MSLRNPLRERENNCALDEEDRGWKENFVFFWKKDRFRAMKIRDGTKNFNFERSFLIDRCNFILIINPYK